MEDDLAATAERILIVETSGLPRFPATRAFYQHVGYDEEGRIRDFYQAGDDKIIFGMALAPVQCVTTSTASRV